jgi:hypothetical protein
MENAIFFFILIGNFARPSKLSPMLFRPAHLLAIFFIQHFLFVFLSSFSRRAFLPSHSLLTLFPHPPSTSLLAGKRKRIKSFSTKT